MHKELHRASACTQEQEVPNILIKNWAEYRKRIKPLLREFNKAKRKNVEQGVLLEGLTKLIDSNKESMPTLVTCHKDSFEKETPTATNETGTRVSILTKPVKISTWSKSISLETFARQLET